MIAPYKRDFIQFLLDEKALLFGKFTTKSGRQSPYFINTGQFYNGYNINRLGYFYACHIKSHIHESNCLFGPAYKGIPLVVATAISLIEQHQHKVNYCFNRKEMKTHGEIGEMVGKPLNNSDKLILLDDVITSGLSIEASIELLKKQGDPTIIGVVIAVDRMELSIKGENVIEVFKQKHHINIIPIVTIEEILKVVKELNLLSNSDWKAIYYYREQFGIKS